MKKAFTVAETLITLGIIGVIATLLLSTIVRQKPNAEMINFRKAYNLTTKIVYDMMQSSALYASPSFSDTSQTTVEVGGSRPSGNAKFCLIFASYLNTKGSINCTSNADPTFTTLDGMKWKLPISNFSSQQTIMVDVNGNKKPNCEYNSNSCKEPDQFKIGINKEGKISITDTKALEYLEDYKQIVK